MISVFTGSNSFGLQAALDGLVANFVKEHGDMALERIDGEEAEYNRMREALESLPFLASKKLVILRSPSANKEFVEKAAGLLAEVPETTDVIVVEPKLDKRSAYYKFLKKQEGFQEYNDLDEHGLGKWLGEQATSLGSSISVADARYLVERIGTNQQMLASEIRKLAVHDIVDRTLIDTLTEPTPQSTVFQLLDAAFAGQKDRMLKLYQEQRASKVEPHAIIAMLAWQLHVLAVIKTADDRSDDVIAKDAKLNPFVVRKSRTIANKLSLAKLRKMVTDLTDLDAQSKSVAIDIDDAVQAYLLTISS